MTSKTNKTDKTAALETALADACEDFAKKTQAAGDTMLKVAYRIIIEGAQWHGDIMDYTLEKDRFSPTRGSDAKTAKSDFLKVFMSHSTAYNDAVSAKDAAKDAVTKRRNVEFINGMHIAAQRVFKGVAGLLMFCEKHDKEPTDVTYLDRRRVVAVTDSEGEQHKMTLAQCQRLVKRESNPDATDDPKLSKATLVDLYQRLRSIVPDVARYEKLADLSDNGYDKTTLFAMREHIDAIMPSVASDEYDRLRNVAESATAENGAKKDKAASA